MTERVKKELLERISNAKSRNIIVEERIEIDSCIRGVYGFFAIKENEEIPFYWSYVKKKDNIKVFNL